MVYIFVLKLSIQDIVAVVEVYRSENAREVNMVRNRTRQRGLEGDRRSFAQEGHKL